MSAESSGVFTLKEINRIKIIQDVIERRITTRRAAEHLGISDRQCRRLLARYREGGPLGMASRRCGMRGNRQLPPGLADQALELIKTRYADFGPTLAREKLEELHGLFLGKDDDSLMRLGMDYVDLFQIHRFDYSTPVEETMEALHDVVKAGKARYIGASSMEAWRFAKMQHTAERNGWTRFITMQPQYNLLYREEEREMLPLCEDQGVGVIPWSPMARGRLTRDWSVTSRRTQNDAFALKMYENAALLDKPVIDVVASIAEKHAVPRAHVAIAWLLSKSVITAPIIGATKPEHLSTAISALDFSLSDAEITELEARYLPHPVDGIIPPLPDTPPSLTPPSAIQNY